LPTWRAVQQRWRRQKKHSSPQSWTNLNPILTTRCVVNGLLFFVCTSTHLFVVFLIQTIVSHLFQLCQVPSHVDNPEEELLQHTTEVIHRQIGRRTRRVIHNLSSNLNGKKWEMGYHTVPYTLHCPNPVCDQLLLEMSFFQSRDDQHGIYCCTSCMKLFDNCMKRVDIRHGNWSKLEYTRWSQLDWGVSFTRSKSVLTHLIHYIPEATMIDLSAEGSDW